MVNNEEYDELKIRGVALNKLLVFPVWFSRVKSLCNVCVCVCHCIVSIFLLRIHFL
jgi:hypothetical protein